MDKMTVKKQDNSFLYIATATVNLMAFGSGIGYGWTSPMLPKLNGLKPPTFSPLPQQITPTEEAWITSLMSLGAAFGPILSGFTAQKIGRKKTLLTFAIPLLISNIILIFANEIILFYIARFSVGIATGCVFTVIPVYVTEISEVNIRGLLSCFMGVSITSGTLFIYCIGPFVTISTMAVISTIPTVLFLLFFGFFMPESPHYLVQVNKQVLAEKALQKLRRKFSVQKELIDITRNLAENKSGGFKELFQSRIGLKGLWITNGLFICQQLTGIVGIMSYLQIIFDASGSSISPELSAIIVGIVQVLAIFLTTYLVDKLGRRILFLFSLLGCSVSLFALGTYFYLEQNGFDVTKLFWLPVTSLTVYIVTFSLGIGPLPWTLIGEVFAANVKSLATTLTATICLSLAFLVAQFFPFVTQNLGLGHSFWMFGFCCAVSMLFVAVVVPETKGKTFQEILNMLDRRK